MARLVFVVLQCVVFFVLMGKRARVRHSSWTSERGGHRQRVDAATERTTPARPSELLQVGRCDYFLNYIEEHHECNIMQQVIVLTCEHLFG